MLGVFQTITKNVIILNSCFKMRGGGFLIKNLFMLMKQQYFILSTKGATTQTFLFIKTLRLVRLCKGFVSKSKTFCKVLWTC